MNKINLRKALVYIFYLLVIFVAQFYLSHYITAWGVKPNLFILFSVLVGFMYGFTDGVTIGICSGLILDLYSGRYLGIGILICLYLAIISSFLLKRQLKKTLPLAILHVIIATVFHHGMINAGSLLFHRHDISLIHYATWIFTSRLGPSLVINTVIFSVMYFMMKIISPYGRKTELVDEQE